MEVIHLFEFQCILISETGTLRQGKKTSSMKFRIPLIWEYHQSGPGVKFFK